MNSTIRIGDYVKRDESGTKWHEVESTVAGAAITQCGLRMEPTISGHIGLISRQDRPEADVCKRC